MWRVLLVFVWVSSIARADDAAVRAVLDRFAQEPSVRQVQDWTIETLGLDAAHGARLARQSRIAAAFPEVDVEFRHKSGWDLGWEYVPADGLVDRPEEPVYHVLEDAKEDRDLYLALGARWDLGDLWMSADRLRVWNEQQAVAKVRRDVLIEVTERYFERRRLQAEQCTAAPSAVAKAADLELRIAELTAMLDGFTDGRFSRAVAAEGARLQGER